MGAGDDVCYCHGLVDGALDWAGWTFGEVSAHTQGVVEDAENLTDSGEVLVIRRVEEEHIAWIQRNVGHRMARC